MLPSWTKNVRGSFSARASAGLVIGRTQVGVVEIANRENGPTVARFAEVTLDAPLFNGRPTPLASANLSRALAEVAAELKRRYLPIHVSLPDAAVRVAVFELDELPEKRAAQVELARWRLAQDGGATEVCACQPLGEDGGKQLMFVLAMDTAWHECVVTALTEAGIVAWSLSSNASRQFNRFHDRLASDSGALVSISRDAWALWIWDKQGRPRYARTRWRADGEDYSAMVSEIERSILIYVHGVPDRSVLRVFVAADEADRGFVEALNSRLHEPAELLASDAGITFEATILDRHAATLSSSLAAALEQ